MRIAINGMGRIGRLLFRRLAEHKDFELVAVNDIMSADNLVYLLKYDSVYGTFDYDIVPGDDHIFVAGKKIRMLQADHPSKLPWKKLDIDVVLECSGKFTNKKAAAEHLEAALLNDVALHKSPSNYFFAPFAHPAVKYPILNSASSISASSAARAAAASAGP